jgi:metal-dependent amidase/aminoacylase/carboxypeptidase family protein
LSVSVTGIEREKANAMRYQDVPDDVIRRMMELRRTFHRDPELAVEEERTAETIIEELEALGIAHSYGGKAPVW